MRCIHAYAEISEEDPSPCFVCHGLLKSVTQNAGPHSDEECEMMFPENFHRMCEAFAAIFQGLEGNVEGDDGPVSP